MNVFVVICTYEELGYDYASQDRPRRCHVVGVYKNQSSATAKANEHYSSLCSFGYVWDVTVDKVKVG